MEPSRHKRTAFSQRLLFGVAALFVLLAGAVHNELLGPVVRADPIRADDPLTVRFALFNPAFAVTLKNVDLICTPLRIEGQATNGQDWTAKGADFPLDVDIDVPPRATVEYTCPINKDPGAAPNFRGPIARVTAKIAVAYSRFGQRHHAMSETLAWDRASKVWTVAGR
jgi:hypothetical protein